MHDVFKNSKRIMLKLSGETLKGKNEFGFDFDFINDLAKKIVNISRSRKIQIVVTLGGGNFFRGVTGEEKGFDRATGDYIGMLATVMNGMALGDAIEKQGHEVRVVSSLEIPEIVEGFVRKKIIHHLEKGSIVITSGGTGNPYSSTDYAAVVKALELGCDCMVKGTKVDGIYDKDPMKFPDAKRYDHITAKETLEKGLRIMDLTAVSLALEEKLPLFVCKIDDIEKIGSENVKGTYVYMS